VLSKLASWNTASWNTASVSVVYGAFYGAAALNHNLSLSDSLLGLEHGVFTAKVRSASGFKEPFHAINRPRAATSCTEVTV
jgi:hypothetical protein